MRSRVCDVLTKRSEVQDMGGAARREAGIVFVNFLSAGRSSDTSGGAAHTLLCEVRFFVLLFSVHGVWEEQISVRVGGEKLDMAKN